MGYVLTKSVISMGVLTSKMETGCNQIQSRSGDGVKQQLS